MLPSSEYSVASIPRDHVKFNHYVRSKIFPRPPPPGGGHSSKKENVHGVQSILMERVLYSGGLSRGISKGVSVFGD